MNIPLLFQMRAIFLALILGLYTAECHASKHHGSSKQTRWKQTGDLFQLIIPGSALGATLILKDFSGSQEFAKGFIATGLSVYGLKYMINHPRPSGDSRSFPSGHSAIAFFGSGFIHKRYGWQYAIPAYAAALCVGYSRIKIKEHWVNDVVGGAAIGVLCSMIFTTRFQYQSFQLQPVLTPGGVAIHCEGNF